MYNLSGGIRAWNTATAVGPEDQGLELFSGYENTAESLVAAFALEQGLQEFYLIMETKVENTEARELFAQLAAIEVLHQDRLLTLYRNVTKEKVTMEEFTRELVAPALEGGMTTEEYLERYSVDFESTVDILGLAISIEAQALDLYQRAAAAAADKETAGVFQQIAKEERSHLQRLADHLDRI